MKLIISGIVFILLGYLWMFIIVKAGYTNAWWWFPWKEYKYILGAFHLIGAVIIGLGINQRKKQREASQ